MQDGSKIGKCLGDTRAQGSGVKIVVLTRFAIVFDEIEFDIDNSVFSETQCKTNLANSIG